MNGQCQTWLTLILFFVGYTTRGDLCSCDPSPSKGRARVERRGSQLSHVRLSGPRREARRHLVLRFAMVSSHASITGQPEAADTRSLCGRSVGGIIHKHLFVGPQSEQVCSPTAEAVTARSRLETKANLTFLV